MMLMRDEIKAGAEAVLFVRGERVGLDELVELLEVPLLELKSVLDEMISEYNENSRGIQIIVVEGGYLMCTRPEYAGIMSRVDKTRRRRLSASALETLAIIAYRQPVSRAEIEKIRGVKSERTIHSLVEKGLIAEAGRKDVAGRPLIYATTDEFLRLFGLISLKELPRLEEED